MTSTESFKTKFKRLISVFQWDLKSCSTLLIVFSIIAGVLVTISLTLCIVIYNAYAPTPTDYSVTNSLVNLDKINAMYFFQIIASTIIYYLTIIFTIIYTVKSFSYLHNKRKSDLYGALPISRRTLYFSKLSSVYIFSVLPAIIFMAIIALISICFGQGVESELINYCLKILLGTLACVTAYGTISICCGTTGNSVIMFIAICVAYPLSALFIKGVIDGFYYGLYQSILKDNFILNALNPLAAYDGINILYWLLFSVVCILVSSYLIKNRKAEKAQSSFAYYLPCYVVEILVAFIAGMLLGVIFGSLNVFSNALLGFIFGFILASVPSFIICHLIFYKGFSNLLKSSISLGGLIVVVVALISAMSFDITGYNNKTFALSDVESAGYVSSQHCYIANNESYKSIINNSYKDFTDKDSVSDIYSTYTRHLSQVPTGTNTKFISVWVNIITNNVPFGNISNFDNKYSFAFTLKDGSKITRTYSEMQTQLLNSLDGNQSYYSVFNEERNNDIFDSSKYVSKYSALANANDNDFSELSIIGSYSNNKTNKKNVLQNANGDKDTAKKIIDALKKDAQENHIYSYINNISDDEYYADTDNFDDDDYSDDVQSESGYYDDNSYKYDYDKSKDKNPNRVCQINLSAIDQLTKNETGSLFDIFINLLKNKEVDESYTINKDCKNTIQVLQSLDIIDKNGNLK